MTKQTTIKLHANPTGDVYEVIHGGETVGFYWAAIVGGNCMLRAVGRGAQKLGDYHKVEDAVETIVAAANAGE